MNKLKTFRSQFKHELVRFMESSDKPASDVARTGHRVRLRQPDYLG